MVAKVRRHSLRNLGLVFGLGVAATPGAHASIDGQDARCALFAGVWEGTCNNQDATLATVRITPKVDADDCQFSVEVSADRMTSDTIDFDMKDVEKPADLFPDQDWTFASKWNSANSFNGLAKWEERQANLEFRLTIDMGFDMVDSNLVFSQHWVNWNNFDPSLHFDYTVTCLLEELP